MEGTGCFEASTATSLAGQIIVAHTFNFALLHCIDEQLMAHTQSLVVVLLLHIRTEDLAEESISEYSIVEGVVEVARLFTLQCVTRTGIFRLDKQATFEALSTLFFPFRQISWYCK